MKFIKFMPFFALLFSGCTKDEVLPQFSFSAEERNWFIYQPGQSFKFKNTFGDSIIFSVTTVRNELKPEYKDPFTNPVEIGKTEVYEAQLKADADFISIYFYKEIQYNSDPNKMRQTIGWHEVTGQFVEIAFIKDHSPFTSKNINGVTYTKVSAVTPINDHIYPWSKWKSAYYDQKFGFIELIDITGVSWFRE